MRRFGLLALAVGFLAGADEPAKDEARGELLALRGIRMLASLVINVGRHPDESPRDDKEAAIRKELAKFQGTWQLVSAVTDGGAAPEDRVRPIRVAISGNRHTVRIGDRIIAHDVRFEIDPTKTPREVTDTIEEGPDKGKQILGIYRLEGDTLTSCVAPAGKDRPTEFASKPGSGIALRVFKRVADVDEAKDRAIKAELGKFKGTWRFASLEIGGKAVPIEPLKEASLVLDGDRYAFTDGNGTVHGIYKVDPTVTPKTIDITFTDGPEKGKTILGIYELTDDTYTLCIGMGDKPRPTEFASKPGSGHALEVLKRQAP